MRIQSRFFCGKFSATNHQFEVVGAKLKWGKWFGSPEDHHHKVASPKGIHFGADADHVYVCSAGNTGTLSGTEGRIILQPQNSTDKLEFEWNVPLLERKEHRFTHIDRTKYVVVEDPISAGSEYNYRITVIE